MTTTRETRAGRAAEELWQRWRSRSPAGPLPEHLRPVDLDQGWEVATAFTALVGPRIGWKVAASSVAGQQHIGVPGPIAGPLLAAGVRTSGASAPLTSMASVEPEIAFRLAGDLPATGRTYDRASVLAAVADVVPVIEVPDSRFSDVPAAGEAQLVADLACSAHVIVGEADQRWPVEDLKHRRVVLRINGEVASQGVGANALGDPCDSLVWLVNTVTGRGGDLRAGDLVLTGAAAAPRPVRSGDAVSCEMEQALPVTTRIS